MPEEKSTALALKCPTKVLNPNPNLKLTDDLQKRVCKLIRAGNFRNVACATVGIHSRTLRRWLHRASSGEAPYFEFAMALEQAEAEAEALQNTIISQSAGTIDPETGRVLAGDWKAAAWWLERRFPHRYGPQIKVAVANELEKFFNILQEVLDRESLQRVYAAIAASGAGQETPIDVEFDVEAG